MRYSLDYNPPALALKVGLNRPLADHSIVLQAKIDTGADVTVIPEQVIGELKLIPSGRIFVSSFDAQEE